MDRGLITRRLSQYGAAWLASFLVTLIVIVVAVALKVEFVTATNMVLELALILLGLLVAAAVLMTLIARGSVGAKITVVVLAVVLVLPLLWAPVLGAVLAAKITGHAIEYSGVYAQFRIVISQLLYPMTRTIFSGQARDMAWNAFQAVASVIGFIASALQIWGYLRKRSRLQAA
jgi:hypothetical protein